MRGIIFISARRSAVDRRRSRLTRRSREVLHLRDDVVLYLLNIQADRAARLNNEVTSAQIKALKRKFGTVSTQAGKHDDRRVDLVIPSLDQKFNAVHLRHFNIQENHIDFELLELIERNDPVCRGGNDLD